MTVRTLATALLAFGVGIAGSAGQTGMPQETEILRGTIDIHVHSDPDNVPRSVDGLEAARLAHS